MIEFFFLLVAVANMAFASLTTFYGPTPILILTAFCSLLAWPAAFLSAGQSAGWGLLAAVPWTMLLMVIGWFSRKGWPWSTREQNIPGL